MPEDDLTPEQITEIVEQLDWISETEFTKLPNLIKRASAAIRQLKREKQESLAKGWDECVDEARHTMNITDDHANALYAANPHHTSRDI